MIGDEDDDDDDDDETGRRSGKNKASNSLFSLRLWIWLSHWLSPTLSLLLLSFLLLLLLPVPFLFVPLALPCSDPPEIPQTSAETPYVSGGLDRGKRETSAQIRTGSGIGYFCPMWYLSGLWRQCKAVLASLTVCDIIYLLFRTVQSCPGAEPSRVRK